MADIERRFLRRELKTETGADGKRKIVGYAAVFNSLSDDLGGFREMVLPGAFAQAIVEDDVRALVNHNAEKVLGRNTAGTLKLAEDEIGLRYEIDPPDTQAARDLIASLERGDIDQSSFGFRVVEDSWLQPTETAQYPVRKLLRVKLFDVSPVTYPAYAATSADVRAMAQKMSNQPAGAGGDSGQERTAGRLAQMGRELDLLKTL